MPGRGPVAEARGGLLQALPRRATTEMIKKIMMLIILIIFIMIRIITSNAYVYIYIYMHTHI